MTETKTCPLCPAEFEETDGIHPGDLLADHLSDNHDVVATLRQMNELLNQEERGEPVNA